MKLKLGAIQILETGLQPTEMGAIYLMVMGIKEMPETVTQTDLTNIIAFLCNQLDWIISNEEENVELSTKATAKSMKGSGKVKETVLNTTIKTPNEQNADGTVGRRQDCIKEEIPISFEEADNMGTNISEENQSNSEDMKRDNYFDVLFEGTYKEMESDNEATIIKNDLDMVFERHKTDRSTMVPEDILSDMGKHNIQNTENNIPTEHYGNMTIKSELEDGEKPSEDEQFYSPSSEEMILLSALKNDEQSYNVKPPIGDGDPTTSWDYNPSPIPTSAMRRVEVPYAANMMIEELSNFFSCSTCKANFGHRMGLENHFKWYSNKDGLMRCGKKRAERDPNKAKLYQCNSCDKAFQTKKGLNAHVQSIHEKTRYACGQCDKIFALKAILTRHQQTVHTKINSLYCSTCGERFSQKISLTRHINELHQDGKSHKCTQCEKKFIRAETLKQHIATVHVGVKAFSCPLCNKNFGQSGHRNRHWKTCHKRFGHRNNKNSSINSPLVEI